MIADIKAKNREVAILRSHLGEFDHGVDLFFTGKTFDAKSYLIKNEVKTSITKSIASYLQKPLSEAKEALEGKDEQLSEGYSHLTKRQLGKFVDYIQSLIDQCNSTSAILKATKLKTAKVKSPVELTKKVVYMKEDDVSGLKSEHPSKIIYTSECWVYNAKTRRLFKYIALDGHKLSVKGMTIINIDADKSAGKIIRNPLKQLSGVKDMTSRPLTKFFNDIKGAESKASGRLSEDTVIVKCFN